MNILYKILFTGLTCVWLVSCSDDYLDVPPQSALNSGAFYKTMDQAEQAVTTAYGMFCKTTCWDRDVLFSLGDVPSNDCEAGGDFENEVPGTEELHRQTFLTTNGTLDGTYGQLYRAIYFANLALERIPGVLETDKNASKDLIDLRIAELKFIRAINHFYLVLIFGEIPLVDHALNPSEYNMGRSTFAQLFEFIEKDLNEAIPVLKEKSKMNANEVGRVTKGAAKALLAKVYLFESSYARYYPGDERFIGLTEKWGDVLSTCQDIITSDQYRLVGSNPGEVYNTWHGPNTNGYRYMFTVEGDNNAEAIFEVQYINDVQPYAATRAGSLVQWTSPRYYTNAGGVKSPTSYWGLGWPTQSLANEFEPGDIRFNTCISKPGDSIQIARDINVLINFENTATGYYCNKFTCSSNQFADAGGHGWQKSPANGKLLRLGDVYLMAAEACIVLDNDQAATYINAIRSRARTCGGGVGPADYVGKITIDQLIKERRVELAYEGCRFYDLVRWNRAVSTLNNTNTPGGFVISFESPKYDFKPLPDREVALSSALTQKYGW